VLWEALTGRRSGYPTSLPDFTPGDRLTQERPDEPALNAHGQRSFLKINQLGLAWEEAEKGRFRDGLVLLTRQDPRRRARPLGTQKPFRYLRRRHTNTSRAAALSLSLITDIDDTDADVDSTQTGRARRDGHLSRTILHWRVRSHRRL